MEMIKYAGLFLFIGICLMRCLAYLRLHQDQRGTEANLVKGRGAILFFNEKNSLGRWLGILLLLAFIVVSVLCLLYT